MDKQKIDRNDLKKILYSLKGEELKSVVKEVLQERYGDVDKIEREILQLREQITDIGGKAIEFIFSDEDLMVEFQKWCVSREVKVSEKEDRGYIG